MTVILRDTIPPIIEVAKLGYATVAVYSLLWQSAYQDLRYDKRKCIRRKDRAANWIETRYALYWLRPGMRGGTRFLKSLSSVGAVRFYPSVDAIYH